MQELLIVSAIGSWMAIIFNLLIALTLVRRFREFDNHDQHKLKIGEKAPAFSLETLEGKIVNLEDFADQDSLMIFVSPNCNPCRAQIPNIKKLLPNIEADGIHVLFVSLGEKEATQLFIDEFQIQTQVLISEYASPFALEYKVSGTPAYYWIDEHGFVKEGGFFDQDWQRITKQWAN